ncbi:MAG: antibiotic biosynthesis monooxygenase [Candidatus Acidiferrum sp.]
MFARRLTMQLKPNNATEFTKALETQVIPTLRKQKGFRDELVFMGSNANEAFAISLWDSKENAEAYNRDFYPEIAKTLSKVVEGAPQLHTYEVLASTLHSKAAGVTA